MKTNLLMAMSAAVMILAGCANDENGPTYNWNGEIRLSSGVTTQTRANTQATQILNDETVYAWVDKVSPSTPDYIKAWTLTADGSGNFTAATPQYYPTDGSNLDLYALHGNFSPVIGESAAFPAGADRCCRDDCRDKAESGLHTGQGSRYDRAIGSCRYDNPHGDKQ